MLDKYVEDLVRASRAQEKLDEHLEMLKVATQQKSAREEFLKNASAADLAKLAGVMLPDHICNGCGAEMQKLGSVYQCACGMVKKAKDVFRAGWEGMKKQYKTNSAAQAAAQKAEEKAERAGKNPEKASQKAYKAKVAGDMPPFLEQDRPAKVKEIYSALKRDHPDMPAEKKARIAARQGKPGKQHQGPPYKGPLTKSSGAEKTASLSYFTRAMRLSNGDVDKALNLLESEGYTKLAQGVMPALRNLGSATWGAAKALPGQISSRAKQVGQTFQAARAAVPEGTGAVKGTMQALGQTAAAHPGVAAGTAGLAGFGLGKAAAKYLDTKTASALLEVGDAAGRILAKIAESPGVDIDPAEVAEAIDEAKERENVPGRARRWGIGGGALGGLAGGGAGYGAGRGLQALLSAKSPWLGRAGAAVGALAGGAGGAYLGHGMGAEEAQADRLVSFLRGRRAYQTGAQQGLQAGYLQGLTSGQAAMGEGEGPGPQ